MKPFTLGPVELTIVAQETGRPSPGLLASLAAQVDTGAVRLLDFVVLEKSADDQVTVSEVDRVEFALAGLELSARGLAGYEDLSALAERMPLGTSAAVIAFEPVWSRTLDQQLAESGAVVIGAERIPAMVANAILELSAEI
ncbi:DUF6325 family protein [Microbacterium murale]|uniref:DUF1269 domain-containing protein n=1 Tax=Microbacterium murale TaxID=1081040 RepID=A0ABQ1RW92_9MICO|nr:DUF6325 family protein [Microbacterium murale]GGD81763.1 hypothetical protein GCM10007269_25680 [Microbacterium murale]